MTPLGLIAAVAMGVTFSGLAYVLVSALGEGAENYSGAYSQETARRYEEIFMFIPPKRISEIAYTLAATVFILFSLPFLRLGHPLLLLGGVTFAGCLAGGTLLLPGRFLVFLKNRRRKRFNLQLVDALNSMSNALRAGFSISQAFETVVQTGENPIAQEFQLMLQQLRLGVNFNDAMQAMDKRVQSADLSLVVNAIDIARKTGGNLTEVFDKIALTIRERMRIEARVMTLTAQGRLQGIIVGLIPFFLGGAMFFLKPDLMVPFVTSPIGMGTILLAVMLVAFGGWMISKIIKIDV